MWRFTVPSAMTRRCPISLALSRCARSSRISSSRLTRARPGSPGGAAGDARRGKGNRRRGNKGPQNPVDVLRGKTLPGQPFEQASHRWPQVHEGTDEAAGLGQDQRLLQHLQGRRLVPFGSMEQGLQGKHVDEEARVVGCGRPTVAPVRALLPPAAGWRVCSWRAAPSAVSTGGHRRTPLSRGVSGARWRATQRPAVSMSPCMAASSAPKAWTSGSQRHTLRLCQIVVSPRKDQARLLGAATHLMDRPRARTRCPRPRADRTHTAAQARGWRAVRHPPTRCVDRLQWPGSNDPSRASRGGRLPGHRRAYVEPSARGALIRNHPIDEDARAHNTCVRSVARGHIFLLSHCHYRVGEFKLTAAFDGLLRDAATPWRAPDTAPTATYSGRGLRV